MKPISLNDKTIEELVREFRSQLSKAKLADGELIFRKKFEYALGKDEPKVSVLFAPTAYIKMLALLSHYDSEVAWHGTVERRAEKVFVITDVMVYPQEVTGATVNTDQEAYQQWLMGLDDDTANALRMQAHSHVNMGVTPSSTDLHHQEQIVQQLGSDQFYIFMIWNKRLEHTIRIYDYSTNTFFDDKDVDVGIDEIDQKGFLAASDALVKRRTTYTSTSVKATQSAAQSRTEASAQGKNQRGKKKAGTSSDDGWSSWYSDLSARRTDYDQMIFGAHGDEL